MDIPRFQKCDTFICNEKILSMLDPKIYREKLIFKKQGKLILTNNSGFYQDCLREIEVERKTSDKKLYQIALIYGGNGNKPDDDFFSNVFGIVPDYQRT